MAKKLAVFLFLFLPVFASAQTSSQIEANKGVLKLAPTAQLPAPTCRLGQLWFDTTTATVKVCDDGVNWVAIGGGVPSATIENGVTQTSGCVAGGVLRSISNLVDCGAGFTAASGVVGVGTASTTSGAIRIFNSAHAFYTEMTVSGTQGANVSYTFPDDDGDAGQVLSTNGSGVLDWIAAGGGVTIGDTQVAFATAADTLGGDAGLTYASATDILTMLGGDVVGSTTTAGTATQRRLGTVTDSATSNFFNITGTNIAVRTATHNSFLLSTTTSGSSSQNIFGIAAPMNAGYTGSSRVSGVRVDNAVASTGTLANIMADTGGSVGLDALITAGDARAGVMGSATTGTPTTAIGVVGASTVGTSNRIGVCANLGANGCTGIAALVASNSAASQPIAIFRDNTTAVVTIPDNGGILLASIAFGSLGTPADGTFAYCADCTIANPCAGSGTGALAKRLNGVWVCN